MTEKDLDRLKTHEHERNRLRGELVNELKEKLKSWRPCPTDDFNPLLNVRRKIRMGYSSEVSTGKLLALYYELEAR